MRRPITLTNGQKFGTITDAKEYFSEVRKRTNPGEIVSEPDRSNIIDIYKTYCQKTGYKIPVIVDVTTKDNSVQNSNRWQTTRSFAVITSNGEHLEFSMDKALTEASK